MKNLLGFILKQDLDFNDRCVTYNYQSGTWTTGSLSRTTWTDANLYDVPYATEFNSTTTPTFPLIQGVTNLNGGTIYYAHEVGTDQVDTTGAKTTIPAFIESGDFALNLEGTW